VAIVAAVMLTAITLTACGGGSSGKTASSDQSPKKIAITFHGTDTTPNGQEIEVAVGQPIELDVTADKPGEIHVHSSPEEQEFEYKSGSSTFQVKPIQAPGIVTVESHTLDKVLFKLRAE
jgi:ABC-type glycerol-3-phosphate transport system substrate-binding protein